ncbi:unnamed protein product, partial [Pneumocystis jirovecii]
MAAAPAGPHLMCLCCRAVGKGLERRAVGVRKHHPVVNGSGEGGRESDSGAEWAADGDGVPDVSVVDLTVRVEKVRAQACAARAQRDRVTGIGDVAERDQGGDQEGSGDASAGDHG